VLEEVGPPTSSASATSTCTSKLETAEQATLANELKIQAAAQVGLAMVGYAGSSFIQ
jgi:hypothetical protein